MEAVTDLMDFSYDVILGSENWQRGRFSMLDANDPATQPIYRFALHHSFDNQGGGRTAGEPDTSDYWKERENKREQETPDREVSKDPWKGHYKITGKVDRDGNASVDAGIGVSKGQTTFDTKLKADNKGQLSGEVSIGGTF
jgi:hypothetical protein